MPTARSNWGTWGKWTIPLVECQCLRNKYWSMNRTHSGWACFGSCSGRAGKSIMPNWQGKKPYGSKFVSFLEPVRALRLQGSQQAWNLRGTHAYREMWNQALDTGAPADRISNSQETGLRGTVNAKGRSEAASGANTGKNPKLSSTPATV